MTQYRKKPVVIDAVRWRGYSSNIGITTERPDTPVEITMDNMGEIKWEKLPTWLPEVTHVVTVVLFPMRERRQEDLASFPDVGLVRNPHLAPKQRVGFLRGC